MDYYLLYALGFSVVLNLLLYGLAYILQTDKITDISYASTFLIIAATGYALSEQSLMDTVVFILISLWAIRLGTYLLYRIMQIGHDERFDRIRSNPKAFLDFWIMQGLTCALVSFSALLIFNSGDITPAPLFWIGVGLAATGLIVETIADQQKFRFKQAHPKQFMQSGIWSYIQHPNYTGELLFWWGLFIASIPYANVWLSILAPLWISMILLRFSGVPILQRKWREQYGGDPAFVAWQERAWKVVPGIW